MNTKDWFEISNEVFDLAFEGSALKRAGLEKLKNTAQFLRNNEDKL